jgi:hypothetical protein
LPASSRQHTMLLVEAFGGMFKRSTARSPGLLKPVAAIR